ncbi:MAG: glycine--tRNA ligase subunit beta, partial [Candidatus Eiseniibacteriota bacterium]
LTRALTRASEGPRVTCDLLFEIGVEELPGGYVPPALEQLERAARDGLAGLRLAFGDLCTYGTPRRLALFVKDLAERQADFDEEAMGPAVKVAFGPDGEPTRALLGFCQGKGVYPARVRRVETAKGEYVAVTVHHAGRPALEVLPAMLGALPGKLAFPKSMRWLPGDDARFARPVRWLAALVGDEVVPASAFGLTASRRSYGHRFLAPGPVEIPRAAGYLETLERAFVMADHRARRLEITEQIEKLAREAHGIVVEDEELLDQNNFLVEWPTALIGSFDEKFHALPNEVIITALREHQRFFAVSPAVDLPGHTALLEKFLAVRNGDHRGLEGVRRGNEDVLAARLEDARFYWETDLKRPPAERVEALKDVVWIEGLGSLRDKAHRLESLCGWLAARVAPAAASAARRAALLCKTDLLSEMIGSGKEYAGLQGTIGGYYAQKGGEHDDVAQAIFWHYHPRFAGDTLPPTEAGVVLSIADKLDHVAGAFVAGKAPSGSEDPYGVRRAGNGVVRMLSEGSRHLDLREATMQATAPFFAADPDLAQAVIVKQLGDFWRGRVEAALELEGIAYDIREAALEAQVPAEGGGRPRPGWIDPFDCLARARVLSSFRDDRRFAPLAILFKRVGNILKAATEPLPASLDRARLGEAAERDLLAAFERARERTAPLWKRREYGAILPVLLEMEGAIHGFFDQVMVNVDDAPLRLNRLRLLADVRELFLRGWDLSRVVVEGEKP